MAGRVTNFSYTIESDGSYDVKLEISAGNELQMWTPIKQGKLYAITSTKKAPVTDDYKSWVAKLISDFNLPTLSFSKGKIGRSINCTSGVSFLKLTLESSN